MRKIKGKQYYGYFKLCLMLFKPMIKCSHSIKIQTYGDMRVEAAETGT
jgi:hypothetical protein